MIVNVIGTGGLIPTGGYMIGGSANAALNHFTKALANEGSKHGVRVVGVNPGPIFTDRLRLFTERRAQGRDMNEVLKRMTPASCFSNSARVTPRFNPANNSAPAPARTTYHISVFGSPPSRAACAGGGCTCNESLSRASIILISSGNRCGVSGSGPSNSAGRSAMISCKLLPFHGPAAMTLSSPGRSLISHDSPTRTSAGSRFPYNSSKLRPPQILSLKIGSNVKTESLFLFSPDIEKLILLKNPMPLPEYQRPFLHLHLSIPSRKPRHCICPQPPVNPRPPGAVPSPCGRVRVKGHPNPPFIIYHVAFIIFLSTTGKSFASHSLMMPITILPAFLVRRLFFLMLCGVLLADTLPAAEGGEPRIVNIYNFVRNSDYRVPNSEEVLYEATRQEIQLH